MIQLGASAAYPVASTAANASVAALPESAWLDGNRSPTTLESVRPHWRSGHARAPFASDPQRVLDAGAITCGNRAVLQFILGETPGTLIILALLLFNAGLGHVQQSRAQATLATLKSRPARNASMHRDRIWKTITASRLVPVDVLKLSLARSFRVSDCSMTRYSWSRRWMTPLSESLHSCEDSQRAIAGSAQAPA
jgi:hypothetical protein